MKTAAYIEGRCRGVVRLDLVPKAAYHEGRGREVVRLEISPGGRPFRNLAEGRIL